MQGNYEEYQHNIMVAAYLPSPTFSNKKSFQCPCAFGFVWKKIILENTTTYNPFISSVGTLTLVYEYWSDWKMPISLLLSVFLLSE